MIYDNKMIYLYLYLITPIVIILLLGIRILWAILRDKIEQQNKKWLE
jgi:hypothetical protein